MEDQQSVQNLEEQRGTAGYADTERKNHLEAEEIESIGKKTNRKKGRLTAAVIAGILILLAAGAASVWYVTRPPKGYEDYTVQMHQYYVEYSDEYDYWDVLTIEYPEISGIDSEKQDVVNAMMYDAAMDRTNYWHFEPNDEVKKLQEEHYSLFCSDVDCTVKYHSQYLLSISYDEIYAPANPVWYIDMTKRGLNIDLLTGEEYKLSDILYLDEEFAAFWVERANEAYDDFFGEEKENRETLLTWFLNSDEEWNTYYEFQPYFYVTADKEFIIGISIDPKYISAHEPQEDFYEIRCNAQELEAFRKESLFWEKYELSKTAGEVEECSELQTNLWLGDIEGIWDYWEEKGDLLTH